MVGIAVALLAVIAACGSPAPVGPAGDVNLVILSIDTLRPDHLGCFGYVRDTSPHIDRLAQRSVLFEQAVTVHVATAPAHATVLTGLEPAGHGIRRNGGRLRAGVPTLAERFAADGWSTGGFVSGWTLQRHTELDRGFQIWDDDLGPPRAGARRSGAETTDRALEWLAQEVSDAHRFFLFLHLFEPHWPYEPPARDVLRFLPGQSELTTLSRPVHIDRRLAVNRLTREERAEYVARYDGEIVVADRLVDRLIDSLDRLGVEHNTVVVVLSDHGETLFEREWAMDHGTRPYDEQARVPLIVNLPGDRLAGRRIPDQVSLLDVAPTVLEIFGLAPSSPLPGRSLLPLARGLADDQAPRPTFITARCEPARVPHIDAKLVRGGLVRAVRLPGVKLVVFPTGPPTGVRELYDLIADPTEQNDLSAHKPALLAPLHDELERWWASVGADSDSAPLELTPEVEAVLRELGYLTD